MITTDSNSTNMVEEDSIMKICKNCGKVMEDHATFCSLCGASVYSDIQYPKQRQNGLTAGGINQIIAAVICLIILFIPGYMGEDDISFIVSGNTLGLLLSDFSILGIDDFDLTLFVLCIGVLPYLVFMMSVISIISVSEKDKTKKKDMITGSFVFSGFVLGIFSYIFIIIGAVIGEIKGYFGFFPGSITEIIGTHGIILIIGTIYNIVGCSISLNEIKSNNQIYSTRLTSYIRETHRPEEFAKNAIQGNSYRKTTSVNRIGYIQGVSGVNKSALILLQDNDAVIIGRDPRYSQLIVSDTGVSKKHCIVSYDSQTDRYFIVDTSTNGVFLENGKRLPAKEKVALGHDTQFTLGHTNERFRLI